MERLQIRTWVTLFAVAAAATASAALADGYDNAVANCGQSVLEQPFLSFGDSASYFMLPNGSFKIPRGSAATSAPVCVTRFSPTIRFFLRNDGKSGARLRVDALFKGGSGKIQQVPVATVAGTTSWAPTAPLPLLLNAMTSIAKQDAMGVAFRFTAITGNWKIDRIYVDPLKDS